MVRAKNYETASTFEKVIQRKLVVSFFPDTVNRPTGTAIAYTHVRYQCLAACSCWYNFLIGQYLLSYLGYSGPTRHSTV